MLSPSQAAMYRRLTLGDDSLMSSLFVSARGASDVLDDRTAALVRVAALIAVDADAPAYQGEVTAAISAGASPEQITDVLVVIARVAGSALVMSAAPKLALALGYNVDDGLEDANSREGEMQRSDLDGWSEALRMEGTVVADEETDGRRGRRGPRQGRR